MHAQQKLTSPPGLGRVKAPERQMNHTAPVHSFRERSKDYPSFLGAPSTLGTQRYLFRGRIGGEQEALWSEIYTLCTSAKSPYKPRVRLEQKSGAK
jgi:hypothetical protein